MMGYLVHFNIVRAAEIVSSPLNARADAFADRIVRGSILDRHGNVLAESYIDENNMERRNYPFGYAFAHVIGYNSRVAGRMGLELIENTSLLTSNAFFLDQLANEFRGQRNPGDTLITTLDADLQMAAFNALGNNNGAVVIIEAATGQIRALVSRPTFNPNAIDINWEALNTDEVNSPLLNRVTQGAYAPGSTFKAVTSLAYIRHNSDFANYHFDCFGSFTVDETRINCFNSIAHGWQDLRLAFAKSCNGAYANLGVYLNRSLFRSTADELLFNQNLPSVLPHSRSSFVIDEESTVRQMMMTAIGQGETMVSPYHMALITAAIANDGILMKPYLVDSVVNDAGGLVRANEPIAYGALMTPGEAAILRDHMRAVVTEGTAIQLSGQMFTMAGKTGTAEFSMVDSDRSHSWFIGFTNVDNPELVISIIIEGSDGTDGARAVPIVLQIFNAYYSGR